MKSSKNILKYHFFLKFQNCYFALYIWITFLRQNIFKSPLKWQSMVKICEVIIITPPGGNYDNCSKNSENEITEEIFWLKMVQICSLNITVMFLQNIIEFQYFFQKLSHLPPLVGKQTNTLQSMVIIIAPHPVRCDYHWINWIKCKVFVCKIQVESLVLFLWYQFLQCHYKYWPNIKVIPSK